MTLSANKALDTKCQKRKKHLTSEKCDQHDLPKLWYLLFLTG